MRAATFAAVTSSGHNLLQNLVDEDQATARGIALAKEGKASCWLLSPEAEAAAATIPCAKMNNAKSWEGSATRGENFIELSGLYVCHFC